MEIQESERIFSAIIKEDCKWTDFYATAENIKLKLRVDFKEKVNDFDSKYWDFIYQGRKFVLHYHEMLGDVEIYTDKSNGKECLQLILTDLKA
jgi:hypothetical protein